MSASYEPTSCYSGRAWSCIETRRLGNGDEYLGGVVATRCGLVDVTSCPGKRPWSRFIIVLSGVAYSLDRPAAYQKLGLVRIARRFAEAAAKKARES